MNNEDNNIEFYVLVPVYKVEKYIRECIESVLNQTYQNFKLILVDDGSPDNSGKICDEYAENDNRITVIHQKNMGQIAARMAGIQFIEKNIKNKDNKFLVFLDSDDFLKEKTLEKLIEIINKYNSDMIIYGINKVYKSQVIEYNNIIIGNIVDKRRLYNIVFNDASYNSLCRKCIKLNLIKKDYYENYYNIKYSEDLLQSIYYYKICKCVYFMDEILYNYRYNNSSMTNSINKKSYSIDFTVRQKVFELLENENVFTDEDYKNYRTYCIKLIIDQINIFMKFDMSKEEKYEYLKEIKKSFYYRNYIQNKEYNENKLRFDDRLKYILFRNNLFLLLYLCDKLENFIRIFLYGRKHNYAH